MTFEPRRARNFFLLSEMNWTAARSVLPQLLRSSPVSKIVLSLFLVTVALFHGTASSGEEPKPGALPDSNQSAAKSDSIERSGKSGIPAVATAASPKVVRYARHLLTKYDANHDGQLQQDEWRSFHGHPESIDVDGDGIVTFDELTRWIADYGRRKQIGVPVGLSQIEEPGRTLPSETRVMSDPEANEGDAQRPGGSPGERRRDLKYFVPNKRLPAGLPDWFMARDLDGDGQLTPAEFSPAGLAAELADFANLDANGDQILTAKECVRKTSGKTGSSSKDPNK